MNFLKIKKTAAVILGSLLGSYLYLVPFFYDGKLRVGHWLESDANFHLSRLYGLNNAFSHPINYISFKGVGQGVNYFYPWLTFYPAHLLANLLHNEVAGFIAFLFMITCLTFVLSYYSARALFNSERCAVVFSIIYPFSAGRAVNVFQRADIGEIIAMAFFPVVLLCFYKLVLKAANDYWLLLAVSSALIIYSHVLSSIFLFFTLLLLLLCSWSQISNKAALLIAFLKSAFLTLGLTAFFWLPLLQQVHHLQITPPSIKKLADSAVDVSWLLTNSLSNSIGNGNSVLGLVLTVLFIGGALKLQQADYNYRVLWFVSAFLLFLTTNLFPWFLFQNTPIKMIQFPWRFIEVATLLISVSGTWLLRKTRNRNILLLLLLVLAIHTATSFNLRKGAVAVIDGQNYLTTVKNTESSDYYPLKSSQGYQETIAAKRFIVDQTAQNLKFHASNKQVQLQMLAKNKAQTVDTPFLRYLGTSVHVEGKKLPISTSPRGTVLIKVPAKSTQVTLTSSYTKLGNFSKVLSLFSLAITFLIGCWKYFKLLSN